MSSKIMSQFTLNQIIILLFLLISVNNSEDEPLANCQSKITPVRGIESCNCDPKTCGFYDDCCQGIHSLNRNSEFGMAEPSCVKHPGLSELYDTFVWDKCPSQYSNNQIKESCEMSNYGSLTPNLVHFIPAIDKKIGLIFRNAFCAVCNGIIKDSIQFIDYEQSKSSLKCEVKLPADNLTKSDLVKYLNDKDYKCHLKFKAKKSNIRYCFSTLKKNCPINSTLESSQKCDAGPTRYTLCFESGLKVIYKNKDCALCHMGSCKEMSASPVRKIPKTVYSYAILFDFNIDEVLTYFTTTIPPLLSVDNQTLSINESSSADFNDTSIGESQFNFSDSFNEWMSLITTICLALSITALCILIFINLVVRELRNNVNGFLVILLSLSLLAALITFMIAMSLEAIPRACYAISVLMHYLYLCSFALMSLNGFDLLRTFLARSLYQYSLSKKKVGAYLSCGFLIPGLITAGSVTMDLMKASSHFAPKYASPRCWLNERWGLITWFYMPIALSVLFNIVVCVILLGYFCVTYRRTSQAIRSRRQLVVICLKVSIVLGVTWSLTLLSSLIKNSIIKNSAAIVNALQGFLVALCFLMNRRTFQSVKSSLSTVTSSTSNRSRGYKNQESGGRSSRLLSSASEKPRNSLPHS